MWKNCYEWRKTAEGVGIDELYRQIDPFDVRYIPRPAVVPFRANFILMARSPNVPPPLRPLFARDSTQNATTSSSSGRSSSTRCVSPRLPAVVR